MFDYAVANGLLTTNPVLTIPMRFLHEQDFASDAVEKAPNHSIGGVRGVYNRAQYSDWRRQMLQHWADYIENLVTERKVIAGNFSKQSEG